MVPQPAGRVQIAGIGGDPVLAVGHDDQTPGAFVQLRIVQLETGKVVPVGGMTYQKGLDPLFPHQRPQTFAALFVFPFGHDCIRLFGKRLIGVDY